MIRLLILFINNFTKYALKLLIEARRRNLLEESEPFIFFKDLKTQRY